MELAAASQHGYLRPSMRSIVPECIREQVAPCRRLGAACMLRREFGLAPEFDAPDLRGLHSGAGAFARWAAFKLGVAGQRICAQSGYPLHSGSPNRLWFR